MKTALFGVITQRVVVISYRRFGTVKVVFCAEGRALRPYDVYTVRLTLRNRFLYNNFA